MRTHVCDGAVENAMWCGGWAGDEPLPSEFSGVLSGTEVDGVHVHVDSRPVRDTVVGPADSADSDHPAAISEEGLKGGRGLPNNRA